MAGAALVAVVVLGALLWLAIAQAQWSSSRTSGGLVNSWTASGDFDGDDIPDSSDNCPSWPNADQALPPWPVILDGSDPDCDGFPTNDELYMGTDPDKACAATNTANDEGPADAWPFDFDDNRRAAIGDVISFIPVFNTFAPGPPYDPRYDLDASGGITLGDVLMYIPVFILLCTP